MTFLQNWYFSVLLLCVVWFNVNKTLLPEIFRAGLWKTFLIYTTNSSYFQNQNFRYTVWIRTVWIIDIYGYYGTTFTIPFHSRLAISSMKNDNKQKKLLSGLSLFHNTPYFFVLCWLADEFHRALLNVKVNKFAIYVHTPTIVCSLQVILILVTKKCLWDENSISLLSQLFSFLVLFTKWNFVFQFFWNILTKEFETFEKS